MEREMGQGKRTNGGGKTNKKATKELQLEFQSCAIVKYKANHGQGNFERQRTDVRRAKSQNELLLVCALPFVLHVLSILWPKCLTDLCNHRHTSRLCVRSVLQFHCVCIPNRSFKRWCNPHPHHVIVHFECYSKFDRKLFVDFPSLLMAQVSSIVNTTIQIYSYNDMLFFFKFFQSTTKQRFLFLSLSVFCGLISFLLLFLSLSHQK